MSDPTDPTGYPFPPPPQPTPCEAPVIPTNTEELPEPSEDEEIGL